MLLLLLRCAAQQPATRPIAQQYACAAVQDLFHKKNSRLSRATLEELLSRSPEIGMHVLGDVLKECAAARTPFLQASFDSLQYSLSTYLRHC